MNFFKKKYTFAILYALLLVISTIYIVLDTFVIKRTYNEVTQNDKIINSSEKIIKTNNIYSDDNIIIEITEYRENNTAIHVADIKLNNPSLLKTAFAKDSYGKNITEKTSAIASSKEAILAINGDYYGVQEKGYVLKNGVIYRSSPKNNQEDLVIYKDGRFNVIKENEVSLEDILENEGYNLLSFGPSLLLNNEIQVSKTDEVGKAMASNPRTAIGIINDLHYVFVVSDGRTSESKGLSLYELAAFMKTLDVNIAYNLDGGGSTTMYFNGKVINNPTTSGKSIKERSVSDIVYIGY